MISPKLLGALAFASVLGLSSCAARAQVTTQGANWTAPAPGQWRITFGSNGTPLLNQGGRAYVPGAGGAVGVRDTGSILRGPAITATRNVPWAAVVRGAVAAGRIATPIGAAMVLASLLEDARIQADGQGGLHFDPGVDPVDGVLWCTGDNICRSTHGAAAQAFVDASNAAAGATCPGGGKPVDSVGSLVGSNSESAVYELNRKSCDGVTAIAGYISVGLAGTAPVCPPSWDSTVPEVDADGKCKTGRYSQPIGDELATQRLDEFGQKGRAVDVLRESVERGVAVDHDPAQVTGPAGQPGGTTTTQRVVNGVPQTVTTTVTNNYNYAGDTITNNTSTRTVVTNTQTGEVISDDTTTESGTPPESVDICAENPGTVMCTKLGQPAAEQPTWQTRDVLWTTEALGLPAGCPAPITAHLAITNQDLSFDWTPVCSWAPMVRAGMLALVAMSCGLYLIAAVRGSRT